MTVKVGQTLVSTVDGTSVVVVRVGNAEVVLTCGGVPMVDPKKKSTARTEVIQGEGTQIGKRYSDSTGSIEVLCTKAGEATLAINGVPLQIKSAKPLPASD